MERIIAKLVGEFENGHMSRRQLIQSLTVAATAASAGIAASPAPGGFKTLELDHISYQVTDYAKTRDFYADLMGMTVKADDGKSQCELHFGNSMLIARNRRQPAPADSPVKSLVDHFSFRTDNWNTEKVKAELLRRGLLTPDAKPDTGDLVNYSSFHVKDPDGYNLQISGWVKPGDSVYKKPGK